MFKIEFETENDAFAPVVTIEIRRLLRQVSDRVDDGQTEGTLADRNGNTVGRFSLT